MSNKLAVTYFSAVTLRAEDFSCYLESQGANEPPSVRRDDGTLLSFERSVFRLESAETSMMPAKDDRPIPYGGTVRLVCPSTQLCAVVIKTESGTRSKVGFKVVMRPVESVTSANSHFKVLSKYKQRSEMDHVFHGDNIVLLLENSDLFINVIEANGALELVAALEPCSWTLTRYDRGYAFGPKSTIAHSGRVIAFEHRAHAALLTCGPPTNPQNHKRSILRRSLWQVVEAVNEEDVSGRLQTARLELPERTSDVYFAVNATEDQDTPVVEQFQCSCTALWIVENADPSTGGPLQVGEQYRVRHVPTGRYLTVAETVPGKFVVTTLTTSNPRLLELSLFEMDASAENDMGHISSYHSYVRLRHCSTNMFLGASECSEFAVVPTIANARLNTRDRIILRHPSSETEQRLFFVMSHAAFLQQYIQRIDEIRAIPVSPERAFQEPEMKKVLERVSETLFSLLQFCSREPREVEMAGLGGIDQVESMPHTANQRMMQELGMIELLLTVLCVPFHDGEKDIPSPPLLGGIVPLADVHGRQHTRLRNLTKLCFRLLTQIVRSSPQNAATGLKYIDLLLYLEQYDLRVADTVKALLANSGCLSEEQVAEIIEKLVSLNENRSSSAYVTCLALLCTTDGLTGCPEVQRMVIDVLMGNDSMLPLQSIELGRLIITPPRTSTVRKPIGSDADNALAIELFVSHGDIEAIEYLAAVAELFLALTVGSVPECLDYVAREITRDHVLLMLQASFREAKNVNVGDSLKASYMMLAIQLYLVRDIDLSNKPRSLVISSAHTVHKGTGTISGDGAFVRQMKIVAFEAMKNNTALLGDRSGKNRLLTNSASIWHLFVRARMASTSELQELIPILLSMLDGSTDLPASSSKADTVWPERYRLSDSTTSIISCKVQVCAVLDAFMTVIVEDAVAMVSSQVPTPDSTAQSCYDLATSYLHEQLALIDAKKTTNTLLDLVLYESPELVRCGVSLMTQLLTADQVIATDVSSLHVLDPKQADNYSMLVKLIGILKSRKKGAPFTEKYARAIQEMTDILKDIIASVEKDRLVDDHCSTASPFTDEVQTEVAGPKETLSDTTGKEFLKLLRSWEVHEMVIDMLPPPEDEENYVDCIDFLRVFCSEPANAELVGPRWPIFFEPLESNFHLRDVILPLLVLLWPQGNVACPVSRHDIRVVIRIFQAETDTNAVAGLRAILGEGAPRPHQQRDIATVITEENVFGDSWWLSFKPSLVLEITKLLATCGQGNNFVRNLFQKVFPSAVCVRLLSSSTLSSLNFKTALLRFLVSVHLVEPDDAETPAKRMARQASWVQDEVWWRVIRDDFLVRFDEMMTSQYTNEQLRVYTVECALCMEAFFRTVFSLPAVLKFEWIVKELRSCIGAFCHLSATLPSLNNLSSSEKHLMLLLTKTAYFNFASLNDPNLIRLKINIDKCVIREEVPETTSPAQSPLRLKREESELDPMVEEGRRERRLLEETKALFSKCLDEEEIETRLQPVVDLIRPPNLADQALPQRKIVAKLMRCCLHQELKPSATVTVLKALRLLVETTPNTKNLKNKDNPFPKIQEMLNGLGGMKTASVLLDAVDPHIIVHALKFGIALLDGGNTKVQNDFLAYLGNTDEKLFVCAKRALEKCILELQHYRRLAIAAPAVGLMSSQWSLNSPSNSFFYIQYLLRLLQLLCEGHNTGLQDYIREQKDNLRSVNTVQTVIGFVTSLLNGPCGEMEDLLMQCFQLLTEFCQGPCPGNQTQLISCNTCAVINDLLGNAFASDVVKEAAVTCLVSIVEGCTDHHMPKVVLRQVPLSTLAPIFTKKTTSEAEENLTLLVGIFLHILADLSQGSQMYFEITKLLKERPDIGKQTGKIEIMRNNAIELVYFRIPVLAGRITEDSKFKLLWEVDRSSQSSKLASFYEMSDELMLELELIDSFMTKVREMAATHVPQKAQPYVEKIMTPTITKWIIASVYLAVVMNSLLMIGLPTGAAVFLPLGLVQLLISIVTFWIDWEIAAKVEFHKYKKELVHRRVVDRSEFDSKDFASVFKTNQLLELYVKGTRTRSLACQTMILGSLLGVTCSTYFFSFHLFWVVILSPALGNVVAAITQNKKTLSLTILLGMMICYAFSIVGFALFPEDFDTDDDESAHENCNSLSHCFAYIVGTGLRQGGGVGDIMKLRHFGSEKFLSRRIYDFLFFAIMIVVFLNILFGIIIDTFAELRDAKHTKEEDMRLKCFICGIDSHVFDRLGDGFEFHVKHEHNMWQYYYFMHHLRLKDPNDYTGQESYIAALLELKDFSFFPSRCISLEGKLQETASGSDSAVEAGGGNQALTAMLGGPGWPSGPVGQLRASDLREGLDDVKASIRRMLLQRQHTGGFGGAEGAVLSSRGRDVRSIGCQTAFGESVVELVAECARFQKELDTSYASAAKLRSEMKLQVKEIWRLQQSVQHASDLENQVHQQQGEIADFRRQLDVALAEKDIVLRQNVFLQKEADKLVTENSRLATTERARQNRSLVSQTSSFGRVNDSLRESLLERSRLFESLQLETEEEQRGAPTPNYGSSVAPSSPASLSQPESPTSPVVQRASSAGTNPGISPIPLPSTGDASLMRLTPESRLEGNPEDAL